MSSEPTERQGADEESFEDETHGEDAGGETSAEQERLEARARPPTRLDEEEEAEEEGEVSEGIVPPPSDAALEESEENGTEEEAEASAEQAESPRDDDESGSLAEATSDVAEEEHDASDDDIEESEPEGPPESALDLPAFNDLEGQTSEWLSGLFERMNLDAAGEFFWEGDEPRVNVTGADADRLLGLGKMGPKAIEGVETLLQSVFSEDDAASDVYVDVDGKRGDRKEMLEDVAVRMADKAVELSEKFTVSGLNSTERRIIHRRLRDYDGVDTESVGDGIFRRLTIEPLD